MSGAERGLRLLPRSASSALLEHLHLQFQRGQRRPQFVRRVGNEGALAVECEPQALQQIVQCPHQRRDLVRQILGRQRDRASRHRARAHPLPRPTAGAGSSPPATR